ncbi:TPA: WxL domain-containing protein [Enterococcus faecium]
MKKHVTLFSSVLMMSTTLLGAGGVFADQVQPNPNEAKTPITANLTINEDDITKPQPPTNPDEGGGDKPTDISGLFGIAYAPDTLSAQDELDNSSSEQRVSLAKDNKVKYNVGVQDKTRKNDQTWTLKAQLSWDGDDNNYMAGTKITGAQGNVKENVDGALQELSDDQVTTTATDLTISQDSQVEIMKAVSGKTMNGVYNYQFSSPELVIPHPDKVAEGEYTGNITWNLSNAM